MRSRQRFLKTLKSIKAKPYDRAYALPGEFYTDDDWMRAECDTLFSRHWVCVGRLEEVSQSGDYMTFDHVGESVLIVHGQDGKIRAMSNVCRHRATVLVEGIGNRKSFICPYHHWAYDNQGQLLNAPHLDQHKTFNVSDCRLPEIKCELWRGFIFICLAKKAPSLSRQLVAIDKLINNYHLEAMQLGYLVEEVWPCNWKSLMENFMEGYHLTPLHKDTLHKVNPTRLCEHIKPGKRHFGYSVGFSSRLPAGRIGHADLSDKEMETCIMLAVAPGLAVGVGSDYSSFLCLRPDTPTSVRVKMGLIFHGDRWPMAEVDKAVELFQYTMAEDKEILIRVQQGHASRFHQPGPLAPKEMEGTIWDFYQYLSRSFVS